MIALNVEKYCHNCPDFEPEVKKEEYSTFNIEYCEERAYNNTTIMCKYHNRCASQMAYLKKQNRKEDERND